MTFTLMTFAFGAKIPGLKETDHTHIFNGKKHHILAARLEQGAGNDPEDLGLAFHQGPTFINA